MSDNKIVIIGGGPCGLGAAIRLTELNHNNWVLFEKEDKCGGLSSTDIDNHGFLWDRGGHITFSHYDYFDKVVNSCVKKWITHERESWIWMKDRFIPYPFQNNIHRLPKEDIVACLLPLIKSVSEKDYTKLSSNFDEWLLNNFGKGLYDIFLKPYNEKVWSYPLDTLGIDWMGERVSKINLDKILTNTIMGLDDISWGPNSTFKFPSRGGTGEIWKNMASCMPNIKYKSEVITIDTQNKVIEVFKDGKVVQESYDYLINTMPIPELLQISGLKNLTSLTHSSTHIVGIGLMGEVPEKLRRKCWMYFPESNCPFYRATVFSNYSPNNVLNSEYWSLMVEVSGGKIKDINTVRDCIDGAENTKLIDKKNIVNIWDKFLPYGYPTPTKDRDYILNTVQPVLKGLNVYSRGRFGGWKYEVGNMDHSFMQGVEAIDNIMTGEYENTYYKPNLVNKI